MNTSVKLTLDTRRKKKDQSYPIILRLTHLRKTTSIALGHSILEKFWDYSNQKVRTSFKGVSSVNKFNNSLDKEKIKVSDKINELYDKGVLNFLSIKQVKEKVVVQNSYDSFFNYGYSLVDEMNNSLRFGSANSYYYVLGLLKKYCDDKDLKFNELNYDFLKKFESHHLAKGNTINSLAVYMKTIRAIYNKGIKEGLIEMDAYPFKNYKIRTKPTKKRAIDITYIRKILDLKIENDNIIYNYRNYFIASYMLYGISFMDLAFLKIHNIEDGRIKFQRKKTSKLYDIKITDQLKEIFNFYTKCKEKDEFIFPIIKRSSPDLQYKDVIWARNRYNKGLKDIAKLCGIEQTLTSYVSRHSFATNAMLQNIPLQAISTMLGHSKLNTTQIYLKTLPNNILDDYNEKLSII